MDLDSAQEMSPDSAHAKDLDLGMELPPWVQGTEPVLVQAMVLDFAHLWLV